MITRNELRGHKTSPMEQPGGLGKARGAWVEPSLLKNTKSLPFERLRNLSGSWKAFKGLIDYKLTILGGSLSTSVRDNLGIWPAAMDPCRRHLARSIVRVL